MPGATTTTGDHLSEGSGDEQSLSKRIRRSLIGKPLDVEEPSLFHRLSLIPLMAWIGLGADGLSSSSYGPEEAFKAVGSHTYLAVFLGLATSLTVFIISYAYSRIIEHFPYGGGGYIVATHTIGKNTGVVSGCALLVDYMLTITVSLVSCGDAIFSFLPLRYHHFKVPFVMFLVVLLVVLNLRGVKESIAVLAPVFFAFVATHILLIGDGLFTHVPHLRPLLVDLHINLARDFSSVGFIGVLAIFLRAFSLGGGTFTGIEAVSNGMQIMREPKVETGKRTMAYMAASLAATAGGLFFCYYLFGISPQEGRTFNAILAGNVFGSWPLGNTVALITIISEGALLIVAAQTGFVDGPRVMSNLSVDSWLPRRFASLSERLTMQNGVLVMGIAALALLVYTGGSVSSLIVMYSINVFVTFSLSQFGMILLYWNSRKTEHGWQRQIPVHVLGLLLCVTILGVTVYEKFAQGGWVTLVITSFVVLICYLIRAHYGRTRAAMRFLEQTLSDMPSAAPYNDNPPDNKDMTAILLVSGFSGFGLHTLLSVVRSFPGLYKNFVFVSVGEIDSGSFKGRDAVESLKASVREYLEKYVRITRKHGFSADYRMDISTDVVETGAELCGSVVHEFPRSTVFAGKLVFQKETIFHKILHNETAFAIQRRLQWNGITSVILPIRATI